jgi:hypothetical protein
VRRAERINERRHVELAYHPQHHAVALTAGQGLRRRFGEERVIATTTRSACTIAPRSKMGTWAMRVKAAWQPRGVRPRTPVRLARHSQRETPLHPGYDWRFSSPGHRVRESECVA